MSNNQYGYNKNFNFNQANIKTESYAINPSNNQEKPSVNFPGYTSYPQKQYSHSFQQQFISNQSKGNLNPYHSSQYQANQYQSNQYYVNNQNQFNQSRQSVQSYYPRSSQPYQSYQPQQPYQPYQSYQSENIPKPVLSDIFQNGRLGLVTQQIKSASKNSQTSKSSQAQRGLSLWADLFKVIDWDSLLKKKNLCKKQSDTSWVTYQEQSWLKPEPSRKIQDQTDRKFAFPNPYIKYKIIPGVDEKMALDVTSSNELSKGLTKGNLIIWDYHGGPNQQFYIHRCQKQGFNSFGTNKTENDEFILISVSTGFVVSLANLNLNSYNKQNGLCVYPKIKESQSQRWRLKRLQQNSDIFLIESVSTGKVFDCQSCSRSNGTRVIQWETSKNKNQLWKILPA